ncbi:MAG: four-carbon acid sugar kinase family protein [Acidobacteria bacterium]|nr:four-carbon acid sugar kinase family protein [Acidobacteriota bacterium]
MSLLLGAIADDFTGGSDLAGMLAERGVATVQTFGVPDAETVDLIGRGGYQSAVVCLKSRSIPAADACRISVEALDALSALSPRQIQFKYCSTFDSTPAGNIGPVADVLMSRLGAVFTVAMPALPVNGRTQYLGHLFVNGVPLSESPLRHHPLNPMTDSNLVRWLQQQTRREAGLIPLGSAARSGEIALVDAIRDADLYAAAAAFEGLELVTGGSGWGIALPEVWRSAGLLRPASLEGRAIGAGAVAVLSGSCSVATLRQLDYLKSRGVEVTQVGPEDRAEDVDGLVIASSAPPESQSRDPESPRRIEKLMGELARRLVFEQGVRRLIVAGGETAGAVVESLGIRAVEITGILDPGVPSLRTLSEPPVALALKSGNFGAVDFFVKAMERI